MALSGNFSTNKYSGSLGTCGLILSWTATQSIANNTTTISWTLKSNGTMSSSQYYIAGPVTVRMSGTKVYERTGRFEMRGSGGFRQTGTITFSHTQEGERNVAMSIQAAIYSSSVNCTASKTFALDKIDRYAIIDSVTSFDDEGFPKIVYRNPAGTQLTTGLKARLTWNGSGNTRTTNWVTLNDAGGEYTWDSTTLTSANKAAMLADSPTSNTLPVNFELSSILGGTEYTDTKAATMSIINANPTPGAVTYADQDAAIIAKTGNPSIIVQNYSTLRIQTGASSGNKGATITAYKLSINGNEYDITSNLYKDFIEPDVAGEYTAVITTTDSRGNTASASKIIKIEEYIKPSANIDCSRVDNFYSNTILKVTAKISDIAGTNTLTITARHKELPNGNWISDGNLTDGEPTTLNLPNTSEWAVEITVADEYQQTIYTATIAKGVPIFFYDRKKHSVAVNGLPDADNQLFIGGTLKTTGKITAPSMSVANISSQYTLTKTSGAWSVVTYQAQRTGNAIHFYVEFQGSGSAVSAGSNGFVGAISAGPLPAVPVQMVSFYTSIPVLLYIDTDGTISARPLTNGFALASSGRLRFGGVFITL